GFWINYEQEDEKIRSNKKTVIKNTIWIAVIVVVSLSVAWGIIFFGADYLGIGFGRGHNVEITIPNGASTKQIAEILEEKGIVKSPLFFRVYSKIKKYDGKYQSGTRVIDSDSGYSGIAEELTKKGVARKSNKVTILEGWNIDQIALELENKQVCSAEDFKYQIREGSFDFDFVKEIPVENVYYRLEGYLYPDTYDFLCYEEGGFSSEECAYYAIDKMLQNLDSKITDDFRKKIDKSDYTFHQVLTMASVVEQEAGLASQENRNKVAKVFYNRLEGVNWDGPAHLQSDPTTHYPYGNGKYNTYKVIGLPAGPLCSPSIASIKAAITPDSDSKATYFVTDSDGKFYFNESLSGHNKTVSDLKAKGKWIYSTLGE
ncbi:MAG: endolytic transglycosylase MltG, partial [Clostridia bacterium]|nr:endolytic transglycosylase MltG [Clostridia bacterium]